MGNSYTGGKHYDDERSKKFVRKLLYGGMGEPKLGPNYLLFQDKKEQLDVNQQRDLKRKMNIYYSAFNINDVDDKKFDIDGPDTKRPCFISISSEGKIFELCTFNIFVSDTIFDFNKECYYVSINGGIAPGTRYPQFLPNVVYNYPYIGALCDFLYDGEPSDVKLTLHNVGEYLYPYKKTGTFTPPNENTPCYDDAYYFNIPSIDTIIQASLLKGHPYEKYNTAYLSLFIPSGATIIDVGANIGSVSIPLSRLHRGNVTVIACELFNETRKILDKNINVNKAYNVIAIQGAIGDDKVDSVRIDISDREINQGHIRLGEEEKTTNDNKQDIKRNQGHNRSEVDKKVITRMKTIDSMMGTLGHIHAIKVDVEGAEGLVFYGARNTIRKYKPVIMFEKVNTMNDVKVTRPTNWYFDFVDFLGLQGYKYLYKLQQYDFLIVHPDNAHLDTKLASNIDIFRVEKIHDYEDIKRPDVNIKDAHLLRPIPMATIFEANKFPYLSKYAVYPANKNIPSDKIVISLGMSLDSKHGPTMTWERFKNTQSRKTERNQTHTQSRNQTHTQSRNQTHTQSRNQTHTQSKKTAQSNRFMAVASDTDDEDEGAIKED